MLHSWNEWSAQTIIQGYEINLHLKKNDRLIICKQILLLHIRWAIARKYMVKIIFSLLHYFQTILLIKISHDSAILENMSILYMTKIVLGLPLLTE